MGAREEWGKGGGVKAGEIEREWVRKEEGRKLEREVKAKAKKCLMVCECSLV